MKVIGREKEINELTVRYESNQPEFIAIYGRRRVGKTFLVKNTFGDRFAFYATGMANEGLKVQLANMDNALREYGYSGDKAPNSWFEAFAALKDLLKIKPKNEIKVIFFDELPWFDTPKSGFLSAFEHFWNSWASSRPDIKLIVCGSATSWIIGKIINNKGGLYNRLTGQIHLEPFTLSECKKYFEYKDIVLSNYQQLESYMIFGGIPYYLNMFDKKNSLPQNVDALCFDRNARLDGEFDRLFATLFNNYEKHIAIVDALGSKAMGLTREELLHTAGMDEGGGGVTRAINELIQSGFIRKYRPYAKKNRGSLYQLVDFFTLFYLKFLKDKPDDEQFWLKYSDSSAHNTWSGYSFEMVCLLHMHEIKKALGVNGVITDVSSWRSIESEPGAQIDLVIDRNDGVINLCEMKYSNTEYTITKAYDRILRNKRAAFRQETGTKKALHQTMVTTYGLMHNEYYGSVQSEVTMDNLF